MAGAQSPAVGGGYTTRAALVAVAAAAFVAFETWVMTLERSQRSIVLRGQMILVIGTVVASLIRYVWVRLIVQTRLPRPLSWLAGALVASFSALALLSYPLGKAYVGVRDPYPFVLATFVCLGTLFFLVTCLGVLDLLFFVARRILGTSNAKPSAPSESARKASTQTADHAERRAATSFARFRALVACTVALSLAFTALTTANQPPTVVPLRIEMPNLPKRFDGMTLVQISDVHLGPTVGANNLREIVSTVNALAPDAVVITGDLVDTAYENAEEMLAEVKRLRAPKGVFYVTGNHEYLHSEVDRVLEKLASHGLRILRNAAAQVSPEGEPGDRLYIAGVDDYSSQRLYGGDHAHDPARALGSIEPGAATVLLAHQPNGIPEALALGRLKPVDGAARKTETTSGTGATDEGGAATIGLVLCGHTHGGQMLPFHFAVYAWNPFFRGLYRTDSGASVYVSEGTNYWGPPMRLWSQRQLTHVTLSAAPRRS